MFPGSPKLKPAPLPQRGDSLPREDRGNLTKYFTSHDEAVRYAKLFKCHLNIACVPMWDAFNECIVRRFRVSPPH